MSDHKTIKINPTLFSMDKKRSSSETTRTRKKKPDTSFLKPNNIKKEFLARIKEHQRKKEVQSNEVINNLAKFHKENCPELKTDAENHTIQ